MSTPTLIINLVNESNNYNYKFKATDVELLAPQLDINTSRNTVVQVGRCVSVTCIQMVRLTAIRR